ncbi:DNA cytosine methyltransferase [Phycisphaeraceae bacterium D3-23]
MARKQKHRPTVVELFAGAGLLSHAFKLEGFDVVQAVEMDSAAAETYRMNLGDHICVGDVREVTPVGRVDVLIAGPPCQGFSTLNQNRKTDVRRELCMEVVRWSEEVRPRFVVVENVATFLESDASQRMEAGLEAQGFMLFKFILDAHDFGVAQRRRRSFVIATRGSKPMIKALRVSNRASTVRDAWRGLSTVPDGKNHHVAPTPSQLAEDRMKAMPKGGGKQDVMANRPDLAPKSWWALGRNATDVWSRLRWDEPANTLRTCLLNPSKGRYIHPKQNRVISIREAARLHSIPDTWKFTGSPTSSARQIGNSVPPLLGRAVARAVRRCG